MWNQWHSQGGRMGRRGGCGPSILLNYKIHNYWTFRKYAHDESSLHQTILIPKVSSPNMSKTNHVPVITENLEISMIYAFWYWCEYIFVGVYCWGYSCLVFGHLRSIRCLSPNKNANDIRAATFNVLNYQGPTLSCPSDILNNSRNMIYRLEYQQCGKSGFWLFI